MQIRPASTLALLRDTPEGIEVSMLQRSHQAVFLPGFFVFAGGAVDKGEISPALEDAVHGIDDRAANEALGLDRGGLSFLVAAIRESFEEAGVLLAQDSEGCWLDHHHSAMSESRTAMIRGEVTLAELCQKHQLTLPLDQLAYYDHWVTPPGPPRRFDTRFYIALAPPGQSPSEDGEETIDHCWLRPKDALDDYRAGRRLFVAPTVSVLRRLAACATVEDAMADARAHPPVSFPTEPWPALKRGATVQVEPGEPAYGEVRKRDPEASGSAEAEIAPGRWVALSDTISRLTAPNPGVMTGPGTNTYLIHTPDDCALIDPGPDNPDHIDALLTATKGRLSRILVTHTHPDHSPGAVALKRATGALLIGFPAPGDGLQDTTFQPDYVPKDGERLQVGQTEPVSLRVIHTPGHASNHLCYLHEGENLLFSGDHIMQGSTVVINPPDGDMAAYLASLNRLLELDLHWIAPGHGFLMNHPQMVVDFLVTHRLTREHKVIDALKDHGPGTVEELTKHAYADVPTAIHGVAARSLLAHLLKLEQDRLASCENESWRWVEEG